MPRLPRFNLQDMVKEASRFAEAFPAIAGSLSSPVADPMTERVVEGVRYLAATVLDRAEHFRSNAHDLIADRASPWMRRPIPSATVLFFDPAPKERMVLPDTTLFRTMGPEHSKLTFCPLRPIQLVPCAVTESVLDARRGELPVVRLTITASGDVSMNELLERGIDLYVDGEIESALHLVHALTGSANRVFASSKDWSGPLPIRARRGGLGRPEGLAPDPDGMAPPFGVVVDGWLCPHKFRFIRIQGGVAPGPNTRTVTLTFKLSELLPASIRVERDRVRTNAAIVSNLFRAGAEPLRFDPLRGPLPVRIAGLPAAMGGVYAVTTARVVDGDGHVSRLPDARRLAASVGSESYPGVFAVTVETDARTGESETSIAFGHRDGVAQPAVPPTVSMTTLATNRSAADQLRPGELAGTLDGIVVGAAASIRFRNPVGASRYVPPATGASFALRAVRWAALGRGSSSAADALRACLHRCVPSWAGADDSTRAQQLRIEAIRAVEVSVARAVVPGGVIRRGYAYRVVADESAFRGQGELALFGACLREALSRTAPVGTFVELELVGLKTTFRTNFAPEEGVV